MACGDVAFFDVEFSHGEFVLFLSAVGFGLFALAALFIALFIALLGALIASEGFGLFLDLAFFVLFFARFATDLSIALSLFSGVARMGAFHDSVEADDLLVCFYPVFVVEHGEGGGEPLECDALQDGVVGFKEGFEARIGGTPFAHGGAEAGLDVGEFVLEGSGRGVKGQRGRGCGIGR